MREERRQKMFRNFFGTLDKLVDLWERKACRDIN